MTTDTSGVDRALDTPLSWSSMIQNISPARNEWLCTEFDEMLEVVPLPNFGVSP